jgi:phage shock protein A
MPLLVVNNMGPLARMRNSSGGCDQDVMRDEEIQKQIHQFRMTAATMGDAALDAVSRGDAGLARTAARQAAQYARVALQLETGERQFEPEEAVSRRESRDETLSV